MKPRYINWYLTLLILTLLSTISTNSFSSSKPETSTQIMSNLTEEDVRRIVREEIAKSQNVVEKQSLESLLQEYALADETASSMKYGNKSARFTLQMFSDVECPFCRKMYFEVKKVVDHSKGIINWEYKHFPLGAHNPAAAIEAQALECIFSEQGVTKAWVALDQFIKSTQGNGKGLPLDIPGFVRSFGLNGSLLKNCMLTDESKIQVNEDYQLGKDLGIYATPAVLLKDNQYGKEYLIKGSKTAEQILQAIKSVM